VSTKTFESIDQTRQLQVKPLHECVTLVIEYKGAGRKGITLAPSDIPALALAEMQAAGFTEDDRDDTGLTHFAIASMNLRMGIELQERATAEVREQAELEALALELFNRWLQEFGDEPYPDWTGENAELKDTWLAVARRARELAQEGK